MARSHNQGLRTWVEVDGKAVARNVRTFRAVAGNGVKLLAVVKSNAYGHSLSDFARLVERCGVDMLGVDSLVEALALRREGVKLPILVLGYTLPERLGEAVSANVSISVSSFEQLEAIRSKKIGRPLSIHVKVDTGMHRQGFLPGEQEKLIAAIRSLGKKVSLDGLFTHFAMAKNPSFPAYTKQQIAEFESWRSALSSAGFSFISHASATGGTLLFPDARYDMVRVGIGLYGLWPSAETRRACEAEYPLAPALSWRTIISEVKRLPKGSRIGYDCTETLWRDSVIGICPIGYWHGYPRALSSVGQVLVKGKRARVVGRVSMDMIVVDLTGIRGVRPGDVVTLIGTDKGEEVSTEELSSLIDASHYELVTRINPLIRRIYR